MNFPEILFVQGQMQSKHFKRLQSYDCIYLQKNTRTQLSSSWNDNGRYGQFIRY